MKAAVIVPTLDERANLEPLVEALLEALPQGTVIVVDDASEDGTGAAALALAARAPGRVIAILQAPRLGLARSHLAGFRRALALGGQDAVVLMDADFSHDPAAVPSLCAALGDADVAIGSRAAAGGAESGRPLWRRALTRAGNRLAARLLCCRGVRDLTAGFFAFRPDALRALLPFLYRSRGFAASLEIKWVAARLGLRLTEVPVHFRQRHAGRSKLRAGTVAEALGRLLLMAVTRPRPLARPAQVPSRGAPAAQACRTDEIE